MTALKIDTVVKGIPASPGIVFGQAYVLTSKEWEIVERTIKADQFEAEKERFHEALDLTRDQILQVRKEVAENLGEAEAEIFDAHLLVLEDVALIDDTLAEVRETLKNVEFCFKKICDKYIDFFNNIEDSYLRERVVDIRDVSHRVISNLLGHDDEDLADVAENRILIAEDVTPSEAAELKKANLLGFATDLGSSTSHSAIVARSLLIPAVVGMHNLTELVETGDPLIIDGSEGVVIVKPSGRTRDKYKVIEEKRKVIQAKLESSVNLPSKTLDGEPMELKANIESLGDIQNIQLHKAEGVGLYRTEGLFLKTDRMPEEEEQFLEYRKIVERVSPDDVIIRTLDLGGDKLLSQDRMFNDEQNPFLGFRAIRLCLQREEMFKHQLRAILRASHYGAVRLMYPMISDVAELIKANTMLAEVKEDLRESNIPFDEELIIGVMIEVPSAVYQMDLLAEHCDFFSIGTNDLIQYMFAIDRGNEQVAHLYNPAHPAVLRVIADIVSQALRLGKRVGVCGEVGGDPLFTPILYGLGVHSLSMTASRLPEIRYLVQHFSLEEAKVLAQSVLKLSDPCEVLSELKMFYYDKMKEIYPSPE